MPKQDKTAKTSVSKTYRLAAMALMAAATAVMAQIAIPMPGGVPMTLQTLGVTLAGIVLGAKYGAISMMVYMLMGGVGLPVFSSFTGGFGMLVGPTGGFILSFPIMALIIGLGVPYSKKKPLLFWCFLIAGTLVNYIFGTSMFCISTGASLSAAITACVIPFIPTTIVKIIVGGLLGLRLRRTLT